MTESKGYVSFVTHAYNDCWMMCPNVFDTPCMTRCTARFISQRPWWTKCRLKSSPALWAVFLVHEFSDGATGSLQRPFARSPARITRCSCAGAQARKHAQAFIQQNWNRYRRPTISYTLNTKTKLAVLVLMVHSWIPGSYSNRR